MFENLNEKQEQMVAAKIKAMPERFRRRYAVAMAGKQRSAAIDSQCYECVGWTTTDLPDGDCTSPACSLYPFRPFNRHARKKAAKSALCRAKQGLESTRAHKPRGNNHEAM